MGENTRIITVAGKGGVGKTSISAAIVKLLCARYADKRILAIDADPAVGLSTALGVEVRGTLDGIRRAIADSANAGNKKQAVEMLNEARFRIFDAMSEREDFSFLAIGRPEAAGCYCSVNTYLREVIGMLASDFDYVVIDGEAGIEQINRRVMEKVTHLLLVTDPSKKGTQVIRTIKQVADELVMYEKVGAVVNRVSDSSLLPYVDTGDIPLLAVIPEDRALAAADVMGDSVLDLAGDSSLVLGVQRALEAIEIL